jgi:serine/threonine-protein kinase RsbW
MTTAPLLAETPLVTSERGRWYIPVPWDQADDLHHRLKQRGCASTLCLDPALCEARLELWPDVPPDRAAAALDEVRQTALSRQRPAHDRTVDGSLPGVPARDAPPDLLAPNGPDAVAVCLIVRSTSDLSVTLDALADAMARMGYPRKDIFGMCLSLEEALVNATKHGHKGDTYLPVRVRYLVTAEQVLAEVQDEGSGFDPAGVADPLSTGGLERLCGRGLLLMRRYLSSVRYNDRGNAVTLCKRAQELPL